MAGGALPVGMEGQFYPPTVLAGVTCQMRIWKEEVFGPVIAVVSARDDDEAVALANDCAFGLGSAVWCRDSRRARAVASRIQVTAHPDSHPCPCVPRHPMKPRTHMSCCGPCHVLRDKLEISGPFLMRLMGCVAGGHDLNQ